MAIVTGTPPDSETEVIVSVDETASVSGDENTTAAPVDVERASADEAESPAEGESLTAGGEDGDPEEVDETPPSPALSVTTADDSDAAEPLVQKLYQHKCLYDDCPSRWSRFAVNQEEQDALEAQVRSLPIVQRHTWNSDDREWVTESFEINCQHMRAFFTEALADYQDLDIDLEGWSFAAPYKPLVHRWERILSLQQQLQASEDPDDEDKKKAADQLIEFLQPILAPSIVDLTSTQDTGKIGHDMIWQIFPPGEIVVHKFWGVEALCRVVKYHQEESEYPWTLTLEHVYWDGQKCGLRSEDTQIPHYTGIRRVTSLPVYPLSFAKNPEQIKKTMIARGRRYQQLRGYHFLQYNGNKVVPSTNSHKEYPMNGRVIVDAHAYYESNKWKTPTMKSLGSHAKEEDETSDGEDTADNAAASAAKATAFNRVEDLTELSDENCLLTIPWVNGFDLKAKDWARYQVDHLTEIEWSDKPFDNLVLPGGEKELAWEFVQSKTRSNEVFDDFVPDKGRGIIILMFGPPGVGKTYTAEAVAEKSHVPLYVASAGLLGTTPEVVEPALDHALMLCRMWNAMLLLDEAEIFLGARLDDTLNRNELVSVFLTKLEYYQGILFLTTNRFSRIDHAFQSRVDLFLPYRDLDAAARRQVWTNFFEHFGRDRFDVGAGDLDRLSQLPLNGREIKNLIKSAQMLDSRAAPGGKVTVERLYMLADKRVAAMKMLEEHNARA